jgi:hypothetical protein
VYENTFQLLLDYADHSGDSGGGLIKDIPGGVMREELRALVERM